MPRPAGAKNKTTLEREAMARNEIENQKRLAAASIADKTLAAVPAKKLGKEVLDDLMNLYMGLVAYYQPWPPSKGANPKEDLGKFNYYAERASDVAAALAPFQSPKLSAVAIGAAIVNKVEVSGGMPDDWAPPTRPGEVVEFKPGTVLTPADFEAKPEPKTGAA